MRVAARYNLWRGTKTDRMHGLASYLTYLACPIRPAPGGGGGET
ncbi:hypothetical protein SXCC_04480 [Gluconacetobacter sp. SXCC-1]|nr:hypothetical protein SXCC_04480 [Gluconacetobacter sp. SXCC-1]